jgi:hypothetical protein
LNKLSRRRQKNSPQSWRPAKPRFLLARKRARSIRTSSWSSRRRQTPWSKTTSRNSKKQFPNTRRKQLWQKNTSSTRKESCKTSSSSFKTSPSRTKRPEKQKLLQFSRARKPSERQKRRRNKSKS